jgi:hypothetical protein
MSLGTQLILAVIALIMAASILYITEHKRKL